jgi:hypothetical protein
MRVKDDDCDVPMLSLDDFEFHPFSPEIVAIVHGCRCSTRSASTCVGDAHPSASFRDPDEGRLCGPKVDRISLVQSLLLMTYWYETPDDQKDTWHWMGVSQIRFHMRWRHTSIREFPGSR